jgi:SOS-response transcriptional repressor LexA
VLETIDAFEREYGHPPSIRDLIPRVGLASTSSIHHHVTALVKAGELRYCDCGCRRLFRVDQSGPGIAYITAQDTPADVDRKMAEAFSPVAGILAAFGRYMGDE